MMMALAGGAYVARFSRCRRRRQLPPRGRSARLAFSLAAFQYFNPGCALEAIFVRVGSANEKPQGLRNEPCATLAVLGRSQPSWLSGQ